MASLLICVVDDFNSDPYKDVSAIKVGDVLAVCEDNHPWDGTSLNDPRFRILICPKVSTAEASVLLSPELPTVKTIIRDPMLQAKGFRFDIKNTKDADLNKWLKDSTRAEPTFVLDRSIASFIKKKAPIPNPNVIG